MVDLLFGLFFLTSLKAFFLPLQPYSFQKSPGLTSKRPRNADHVSGHGFVCSEPRIGPNFISRFTALRRLRKTQRQPDRCQPSFP
ncbi:hypothetical protein V8F20_000162 [Naviculisporaceae sp. PSN 640]